LAITLNNSQAKCVVVPVPADGMVILAALNLVQAMNSGTVVAAAQATGGHWESEGLLAQQGTGADIRVPHRPPADAVGTEVGFCMVWKGPD
jgi:hypothetical protein